MQAPVTVQQVNHYDEDTAYYVYGYPYSFGKFCTIRYWIETRKNHGQRFFTQIQDPATGQWFKAKSDGYFDICLITTVDSPGAHNHGWVVPLQLKLAKFNWPTLQLFAGYYSFTPFQKEQIYKAYKTFEQDFRGHVWKSVPEINFPLTERSEDPKKISVERKKDASGFYTESLYDAEKRVRREKRANWPSNQKSEAILDANASPTSFAFNANDPMGHKAEDAEMDKAFIRVYGALPPQAEAGHDEDLSTLSPEQQAFARSLLEPSDD